MTGVSRSFQAMQSIQSTCVLVVLSALGLEWCQLPRIESNPDAQHRCARVRRYHTEPPLRTAALHPIAGLPNDRQASDEHRYAGSRHHLGRTVGSGAGPEANAPVLPRGRLPNAPGRQVASWVFPARLHTDLPGLRLALWLSRPVHRLLGPQLADERGKEWFDCHAGVGVSFPHKERTGWLLRPQLNHFFMSPLRCNSSTS